MDVLHVAIIKVFNDNWHVVAIDTDRDKLMDALADVAQNLYPAKDIVRNEDQVFFADGNAGDKVVGYIVERGVGDYSFVAKLNRLADTMRKVDDAD